MKKVSDLIGAELDYAVNKCEGGSAKNVGELTDDEYYSTNWAQGGPIIEREWICADRCRNGIWWACKRNNEGDAHLFEAVGPSPLVAAMRCYVTSKLGDMVEIPDEIETKR